MDLCGLIERRRGMKDSEYFRNYYRKNKDRFLFAAIRNKRKRKLEKELTWLRVRGWG